MNNDQELLELSLPKNNFISSYDVAYQIVDQAVDSHTTYWQLIKDYQAHISGKKPIHPDDLKKKGMSWAWNWNYGKARAKISKGVAENISKISEALALGYVTFRNSKKEDEKDELMNFLLDENKRGIVASSIGMALSATLAKESRLSGWLNEVEYPSYAFGYCALVFNDFDWMPDPIHPLNIAFKPNTKPDEIKTWVMFDVIEAEELYDRWITARNELSKYDEDGEPKQIASSGWNLMGLESVLLKAYRGRIGKDGTQKVAEEWQDVIPSYKENPSYVISNTDSVSIAKIYHKELDGTLSEVYIPWDNAWQISQNKQDERGRTAPIADDNHTNELLFKKNRGKFNQKKFIKIIRDSGFTSEAGSIQDLRGIAKFAVEDSIRYNRLRNGIGNKMQFVGSPMFEQGAGQVEKFKVNVSQGFVLLPQGHTLIERQPSFDIGSHINVLRFEEGEYNRDTQQFDASIQGRLTSRPNKGEVQRVTEEVEFTDNAKNNIKLRDYSDSFYSVIKRIPEIKTKEGDPGHEGIKRFYENVKKYLPTLVKSDEDVNNIISAIDSFVIEPIVKNIDSITIAMGMAETPFGRNRLKRMLLIAKGFPIEEVNISVPLITDKYANLSDARVAAIENDMFFTTNEVVIAGTDDHITHIESHLAKCKRVIEAVQRGALSPVDAFKYLENNIIHTQNHNELLGQNMIYAEKAKEYQSAISSVLNAQKQIKSQAEQLMRQQYEQQNQIQIDPETQSRIASKNAETQASIQRKDWVAERRTEQREKQIEMNYELEQQKIQADQNLKA